MSSEKSWFAVRCLFESASSARSIEGAATYEERITLWLASSAEHAIQRAEAEAREYAEAIEDRLATYLGLAQSYRLVDEPGDGAEVFSLMRDSTLEPEDYLDTFFDTGEERQTQVD